METTMEKTINRQWNLHWKRLRHAMGTIMEKAIKRQYKLEGTSL